jgi:gluconolactonase
MLKGQHRAPLDVILAGEVALKILANDLQFPEGPVWLPDGSILVVEIRRKTLTQIYPDGRKTIIANLGGGPNGAAIGPDGACYVCNNGGFKFVERDGKWVTTGQADDYVGGRIERVDLNTGRVECLYDSVGHEPIRGPNDIVFDAHGGFYFTDPGKVRNRDMDRGCVCYATADGRSIREVIFPIHKPNGIGLSPDGTMLYVAETETARLWGWRIKAPGVLDPVAHPSPKSPHGGTMIHASTSYQRFDSLAVEASGRVCVGTLDMGGITSIDPQTGDAEFVRVPHDTHVTNLCFGGPEQLTAYITCSYAGLLLETSWPRPGLVLNG